ncbi:MAG: hypothetical protein U1E66_03045 [Rhodospirillales bacterium]
MPSSKPPALNRAATEPVVIVVDDDAELRDALANLFRSVGLAVTAFGSANELLDAKLPDAPACLVLDIRPAGGGRPRISGPSRPLRCAVADRLHDPAMAISRCR